MEKYVESLFKKHLDVAKPYSKGPVPSPPLHRPKRVSRVVLPDTVATRPMWFLA